MRNKSGLATRESLLLTAERLFALNGIEGVSTRAIAQAAGQFNVAALHYHFGSKEKLLGALMELRLGPINARREFLLAELDAQGRSDDLHGLIAALALPMLEQLQDPENHWVGLLNHLYLRAKDGLMFAGVDPSLRSGYDQVAQRILRRLSGLPRPVREARLRLVGSQQVLGAADWYYRRLVGQRVISLNLLASSMIDFMVGGLLAPESKNRIRVGKSRG